MLPMQYSNKDKYLIQSSKYFVHISSHLTDQISPLIQFKDLAQALQSYIMRLCLILAILPFCPRLLWLLE